MANVDGAFGLRPVRHLTGGVIRANKYTIADGLSGSIFTGDLVKQTGTGKNITVGAASDTAFVGVFAGCSYTKLDGEVVYSRYWPSTTALKTGSLGTAYVYDDPQILFEIQADEDVVVGDVGQDADIVAGTGSTLTGTSAFELDSSDIGTNQNLHIYEIVDRPDNEAASNFTKVLVLINEHAYAPVRTEV